MERVGSARRARRQREIALGYAFLAPAFFLLLIFDFFPIFYGLYISSCDWRLRCVSFLGLGNYTQALQDPDAWHSLAVTASYAVISIPIQLALGLLIAYLLFQRIHGRAIFRLITLPLLSPTTYFLLIFMVIGTFKAFNHIYVMTKGGPGDATTTASIYIFKQLFENNRYGYSAALSFLLFFIILVLTVLQNWLVGRRVVYG